MSLNKISNFKGEYFFLSNFYETPVNIEGITYKNSEAAFQAQKCRTQNERTRFAEARLGKRKSKHYERYRVYKI